jgi:phage shock protein A
MINQETVTDASRAIAFADDVRGAYSQLSEMKAKIERYIAGLAAIAAETATAREAKFVKLVQDVVDPEDLARIGALLPTISALVALLESDYDDFIHTA